MKKLLAILLALVVVGGAFAQVTTAFTAAGNVKLFNEDQQAIFAPKGSTYDTMTFKATNAEGTSGFSMTDGDWTTDGIFQIRDWNVWGKGKFTKVILGNLRNGDFRGTLPYGAYANYIYGMDRITGQGVLVESTTLGALTLGVNLPVPLTTAIDTVDLLQKSDIAAKYAIEGVGTAYFVANLDLVDAGNIINFGFSYTGVENLVASTVYKFTPAMETHLFGLGADYTMDKLELVAEFDGQYAAEFDGEIAAVANYSVTDQLVASAGGMYDFGGDYDVFGEVAYDYMNGLGSDFTIGYDGDLYYTLALTYSVSF